MRGRCLKFGEGGEEEGDERDGRGRKSFLKM